MNIVFRADSSAEIGTGHISRCRALGEGLVERGAVVEFVCRELSGNFSRTLEKAGFAVHRLPAPTGRFVPPEGVLPYANWLGVDWRVDADQTLAVLKGAAADWLVVDHYGLDQQWHSAMRAAARNILVIDDLADRRLNCDILLDYSYGASASRYEALVPGDCQKLLGPSFALIGSEFRIARSHREHHDNSVRRILVLFGGADSANATSMAIEAIAACSVGFEVEVIVGAAHPAPDAIASLCERYGYSFHTQVSDVAARMAAADISIGAVGVTTWERSCVGLPSITMNVAANQEFAAENLAREGYTIHLGRVRDVTAAAITHALELVVRSPWLLDGMRRRSMQLVDGRGVMRVANAMLRPAIRLRPAVLEDCESILSWRNDEETRRYVFDPAPIGHEQHVNWFRATLANPDCVLLIGEDDSAPRGVLRYDFRGEEALVSIYLVPGNHGFGYGPEILKAGSAWVAENRSGTTHIEAEILESNRASARAFIAAGYEPSFSTYCCVLQRKTICTGV